MKSFEQIPFNPARWPFFYGWMILFWGVIGILLSVPGQTTGVSAFIEPLLEALGLSRVDLAAAYMAGTLTSSVLLTPAGKLFDRIGARWMGFGSCLLLGIVLYLLSQSALLTDLLSAVFPRRFAAIGLFWLLFFLLRFSGQGVLTMASRNMVMKWFDHHRGLASGVAGAATAYGFSLAPPLFNRIINAQGWSGAWLLLGSLLIVVFAPLLWIFFRDNPEASGLVPDGETHEEAGRARPATLHDFTLAEARRTFAFWAFAIAMAMQGLIFTAVGFNIESIYHQAVMTSEQGFAMFEPAAAISIIVNLAGGWLSSRIDLRWLLAVMLFSMSAYLLGFIGLRPGFTYWFIIFNYGLSGGLFGVLMTLTWPRYYGREHLGAVSGLGMTLMVVFSSIGPILFSLLLKLSASYRIAFALCLATALLLFIGSFRARNPQKTVNTRRPPPIPE